MQSGELKVSGDNFTSILLSGKPREIIVRFESHHMPIPCDCNNQLEYQVVVDETTCSYSSNQYHLLIKWQVSETKELIWCVLR